jgi:hypothetical protein
VTSGPMRRRWPEAHDGMRCGQSSDGARASRAGGRRRGRWGRPGGLGPYQPGGN